MELGQKNLAPVGSIFYCSGWVSHIWFGSPKNRKFFNFFPIRSNKISSGQIKITWVKDGSASHLLRIKSVLGLGWVMAHLYLAVKARTLILEGLKVSFYLAGFLHFFDYFFATWA